MFPCGRRKKLLVGSRHKPTIITIESNISKNTTLCWVLYWCTIFRPYFLGWRYTGCQHYRPDYIRLQSTDSPKLPHLAEENAQLSDYV